MSVPNPDELKAEIAARAGVPVRNVDEVLTGQNISLVPVPPVSRSLDISRLSFSLDPPALVSVSSDLV